ncbi:MAG: hypothetical protein IJB90_06030 [Clostridia bacterium]|nr:hypothetical protein [Clostridia bacterium]
MLKLKEIDNKFFEFIKKHYLEILFFVITVISLKARIDFLNYQSQDYTSFLVNWFNQIRDNGGILALKQEIGDYNVPYLFIIAILSYIPLSPIILIKLVSIVFDYIVAIVSMMIIYELLKNNKNKHLYALLTYSIIIILPTVVLNSAAWAQCDSIYTTFVLISLLCIFKEKYFKAFVFLGISFAFKLQSIFILPVYILIYLSNRKFPIYYFFIIPIVNFVMCLPAIIFGRSIMSCLDIYINQTGNYIGYASMNFPNIYALLIDTISESNLIATPDIAFSNYGTIFTFGILAITAIVILHKEIKIDNKLLIELSLWSVLLCTFFLPSMHDRYLYMADIISIIYFIVNRKKVYIPIVINFVSLYVYIEYLYATKNLPIAFVAVINAVILVVLSKDIFLKLSNKELVTEKKE